MLKTNFPRSHPSATCSAFLRILRLRTPLPFLSLSHILSLSAGLSLGIFLSPALGGEVRTRAEATSSTVSTSVSSDSTASSATPAFSAASTWVLPPNESFQALIPPPPASGSPAAQADLDAVLAMQDHPTRAELDHAEKTVGFTVFTYRESLGEGFTAESHPKTAAFFQHLGEEANARKNYLKDIYKRERPYQAHSDVVKELVTVEHGYSYPSGHSTRAWLFALVLGTLDPPHRSAFLRSAMQVCDDRVLGGMHYPSDMMASRVLAEGLYRDLMKDPNFKADLESLRKSEWLR